MYEVKSTKETPERQLRVVVPAPEEPWWREVNIILCSA